MDYKREEIEAYFDDYINDIINNQDLGLQWIEDNQDDLHHYAFNMDYYIIGTYQAKQWLGNMSYEVINFVKEWEQANFGEVFTDFRDPERVVNMYTYIIGSEIVAEFLDRLEEVK